MLEGQTKELEVSIERFLEPMSKMADETIDIEKVKEPAV